MYKYLCLFLLIILGQATSAQESLSLNKAISIALQRNTILLKAENTLKTYESGKLASYGNLLPDINASGSFNWSKSETAGGTVSIGGIPIKLDNQTRETRTYSVGVQSNWTLFDGLSNIANISRSSNELESFEYYVKRVKQDVTFQTIGLYYAVLNNMELVKFREEDVAWNQKNFETVSERNRLGAVTLADVYAQQVRLGNAELELLRAKNNLETTKSNLLYYLGIDVLIEVSFSDSMAQKDYESLNKDISSQYGELREVVEKALDNRADYISARLTLAGAENNITMAWSGHLPRLTNNLGYDMRGDRPSTIDESKTLYAGLTLSIPIFSGFSVSNQVQIAEVNAENSRVQMEDLKRSIRQSIQKNYLDLQTSEKALDVSARNVQAAEENRRIEQEKYALGSGTILNVLIANSEYQNAQTNHTNALFDYMILSEQIKYLIGTLDYTQYE